MLRDYGECLVSGKDRPLAGERDRPATRSVKVFLAVSPDSPEAARAGRALNTSECLKGRNGIEYDSLKFGFDLLRGALFRAKYLQLPIEARQSAAFPPYAADAAWHLPHADPYAILQAIGECVVRENPAEARRAISAPPGSSDENAAYAALMPALSRCMPRDGTYTFSRARLESIMSEALYFLSRED